MTENPILKRAVGDWSREKRDHDEKNNRGNPGTGWPRGGLSFRNTTVVGKAAVTLACLGFSHRAVYGQDLRLRQREFRFCQAAVLVKLVKPHEILCNAHGRLTSHQVNNEMGMSGLELPARALRQQGR